MENEFVDTDIKNLVIPFSRKHDDDEILKGKHLKATELIVKNVRESVIEKLQQKKKEIESYL